MKHSFFHGCIAFLLGCLALTLIAVLVSFAEVMTGVGYYTVTYVLYPMIGAVAAYFVRMHHVNNYLAWIPAPAMYPVGFYLVWQYLPGIGPMLAAMVTGIIGAATAETKLRFDGRKG